MVWDAQFGQKRSKIVVPQWTIIAEVQILRHFSYLHRPSVSGKSTSLYPSLPFIVEQVQKNVSLWTNNLGIFCPKTFYQALRNMRWGSGIPEKTYPGSRIRGSKMHRIPDPEH
jgi:hypothetical protein